MPTIQEYFDEMKRKSSILRSNVAGIIENEKIEDNVSEQRILRDEFCTECRKLYNAIADKEDELASLKRKLREMMSEQKNDDSKLERHLYYLIGLRKRGL